VNDRLRAILCCPACRTAPWDGSCGACGRTAAPLGDAHDVLDALGADAPSGVGATVGAFYDRHPFPGYGPDDDGATLLDRASRVPFALALDAAVGAEHAVLDLGCGTAQLAAFLALRSARRLVVGCDLSRAALDAAAAFGRRAGLEGLALVRGDLFRHPFRARAFDCVLCRGVVHHTADPARAIAIAAELTAPGGLLVLGWYDRFGRTAHRLRIGLARLLGRPLRWLDPVLRRGDLAPGKRAAWIADQYGHPVEGRLGLGFVLAALRGSGLEFVRTLPPAGPLLAPTPAPTRARRAASALQGLCSGFGDADAGLVAAVFRRR
jgi:SAM-dependent methyltransferase